MDEKTLEALRESIAKWEAIVAGIGTNEGPLNCHLCKIFHKFDGPYEDRCIGCPVAEKTGRKFCEDSPYTEYEELEDDADEDDADALTALAQAEVDFLRSLLPAEASSHTSPVEAPNG